MCGKNKGVVAIVLKAAENDDSLKALMLHCIIRPQSKNVRMSEVGKPVISVVNFMRSVEFNH